VRGKGGVMENSKIEHRPDWIEEHVESIQKNWKIK